VIYFDRTVIHDNLRYALGGVLTQIATGNDRMEASVGCA
jgi:hypothetical protein